MKNKRLFILLFSTVGVSLYFWIVSRYPQLDEKAIMVKTSSAIADTLVTYPKFPIREHFPFLEKVFYSTLNWLWENRKGMTFGIIFASLLQSIMACLGTLPQAGSLLSSVYGFFIGVPLGVCVNCAAPIFKGALRTRRTEAAFAAMLSSPTMNIIVLTMVFTVFPLYMAVTKVLFTLLVIFVFVPLLSKLLGKNHALKDVAALAPVAAENGEKLQEARPALAESWLAALRGSLVSFLKNLLHLTFALVPLMVLAAVLGSILNHAIPSTLLIQRESGFSLLLVAVFIGVLLPVPMAFDVILVNSLFALGLQPGVTLALLCTLGIFSIFSFLIVWTSASRAWALSLTACIFVSGLGVGLAGNWLHGKFYVDRNVANYRALRKKLETAPKEEVLPAALGAATIRMPPPQPPIQFVPFKKASSLVLSRAPFRSKKASSAPLFIKTEGAAIGLDQGFIYGIRDYPDPFWLGRGTAAGDYDGDGWDDVVFGTGHGLALYRNRGGWFERQKISNPSLENLNVYAVAFVDLNNDGWLDLFFTTFNQGNYLILNHEGTLDFSHPLRVPNGNGVLTVSPGFGDLQGSGSLDILNGNMALGIVSGFAHFGAGRTTSITYNDHLSFREEQLGEDAGETMTTLISDLNHDGYPDIYLGHDYVFPDSIFLGGPKGFRKVGRQEGLLARTPVYTMSADSGDVNNDLLPDLLLMGTIKRQDFVDREPIDGLLPATYSKEKWRPADCDAIKDPLFRANCRKVRQVVVPFQNSRNLDVSSCETIRDAVDRDACLLATMWLMMTNSYLAYDCEKKFEFDQKLSEVCALLARRGENLKASEIRDELPQSDGSLLYLASPEGKLSNTDFRHPGGWTWNSKIVDLDNDGWQDVFSAEGVVRSHDYGWNVFMKNQAGKGFAPKQFSYNLTDDFNLISFSLVDFNGDGTLDIIGNSSVGPVQVYENHATAENHSISISLRDFRGNRFGVGASVTIVTKAGSQVREIKVSGGYQSFDPLKAYFGTGPETTVLKIRIRWRDGSENEIAGPIPVDFQYIIQRDKV